MDRRHRASSHHHPHDVQPPRRSITATTSPHTGSMQALHRMSISGSLNHHQPPSQHLHPSQSGSGAGDSRVLRLNNQLRERFDSMRRVASHIRKTALCDVTHAVLDQWSGDIQQAVLECDDLVASLPTRVAEMELGSSRRPSTMHGGNSNSAIKTPAGVASLVVPSPPQSSSAVLTPVTFRSTGAFVRSPAGRSPPPTASQPPQQQQQLPAVPGAIVGSMLPDGGILSHTIQTTSDHAAERMRVLALGVHMCLDATTRSINAEKASICMPVRGVREDLRSVCSVGFEKEDHLSHRSATTSPEVLCMLSGLMLVCSNGTNPPVELDVQSALAYFQGEASESGHHEGGPPLNLGATMSADEFARRSGGPNLSSAVTAEIRRRNATNSSSSATDLSSIVTSLKSRYWSKIVCPIRLNNATSTLGVVTFLNKDVGNSNFSTDDETIVFGAAAALAGMLARCTDVELLSRAFQKQLPIPPFPAHLLTPVSVPGSRNQLVYRTRDPNGGKDLKVLLNDGKAERLDSHTSLMAVSEYIQRMQQSWKDSVLLNAELRRTHEERTRVVTSLLVRARTSELKNTVLEQDRVAMIPDDDETNQKYFRDYAQFKKHKHRIDVIVQQEQVQSSLERQAEERRLRELHQQRHRKFKSSAMVSPQESSMAPTQVISLANNSTSVSAGFGDFGSDDDDCFEDVYAKSAEQPLVAAAGGYQTKPATETRSNSQDSLAAGPEEDGDLYEDAPTERGGGGSTNGDRDSMPTLSVQGDELEGMGGQDEMRRCSAGSGGGASSQTPLPPGVGGPRGEGRTPSVQGSLGINTPAAGPLASNHPPTSATPSPSTSAVFSGPANTSGATVSGGVSPQDGYLSGGRPVQRDRRASVRAKELLFGKEKPPPVVLD